MTNRAQEIEESLITIVAAIRHHQDQVAGAISSAESRALRCREHGWDGVAQGYETAAGQLAEITGELREAFDRAENCVDILHPLQDEQGLGDVADRLGRAAGEIAVGLDGVLSQIEGTGSVLAAIGEEYLADVLHLLDGKIQESAEALSVVRKEIAEELSAARRSDEQSDSAGGPSAVTAVQTRIAELRRQGHAPQRHGAQVTDQQLTDRALWGIDPMTGTTTDGATGGTHKYSRHATKFTTEKTLVEAEKYLRSSEEFKAQERDAEVTGDPRIQLDLPLQQVFGPDYHRHIHGIRRTGSKAKPTGDPPGSQQPALTDFTDGTLFALYRRSATGEYQLITMFPRPKD